MARKRTEEATDPEEMVTEGKADKQVLKKGAVQADPVAAVTEETAPVKAAPKRTAKKAPASVKTAAEGKSSKAGQKTPRAKASAEPAVSPALVRMKRRHGKGYADLVASLDRSEPFDIDRAIGALKATARGKFDSSVELHIRLGVDPRHQDQQLRGTVVLPSGTGKSRRVAVIAGLDKQGEAKEAGADLVGEDDLIKEIEEGKVTFDVVVATPDVMGKVGRLGKVLGTKGLMPNPKSGTVTPDVGKTVRDIKAGRLEFRVDKEGIVHAAFGKASFTEEQLKENLKTLLDALMRAKPAGVKGQYVRSIYLATTMGPSIRLDQKVLAHLHD